MHVAIIMNGNGRWALTRGLPPTGGYREGAAALRATVEMARRAGVKTLTVYANSDSPVHELDAGRRAMGDYLRSESVRCAEQAVRISVIGDSKRLGATLSNGPYTDDCAVARDSRLHLRIVIDYTAHDTVVQSSWCSAAPGAPERFAQRLREIDDTALPAGAVDLLIRTGGGKCCSDFMLWEVAYARLHSADCLWPDFNAQHFQRALGCYGAHERPDARTS